MTWTLGTAAFGRRIAARLTHRLPWQDLLFRLAVKYRSNHRDFLVDVSKYVTRKPDSNTLGAIFVPVCRPFRLGLPGLELAADLAEASNAPLVVVCSKQAVRSEFPATIEERLGDQLVLIDLADVSDRWLPQFRSSKQKASKLYRNNDVGPKRNLAFVLARILGWEYVLFMDDDISAAENVATLNAQGLKNALEAMRLLPKMLAIGWTLEDFNDNSMIGHARHSVDMRQEVFIGGGALLVRCGEKVPYFPDIYNEDWLFLIALAATGSNPRRALGWAGQVHQLKYNPFQATRARSEEAGDVIGECLMNLLEDHGSEFNQAIGPNIDQVAGPAYWRQALKARRELIKKLEAKQPSTGSLATTDDRRPIVPALQAAAEANEQFKADDLLSYVKAWRSDTKLWHRHLETMAGRSGEQKPSEVLARLREGKAPAGAQRVPVLANLSHSSHHQANSSVTLVQAIARSASSDVHAGVTVSK